MRHLDFDELWKNHLFDYKDGDLLVIDDITRLNLSDYEDTAPDFPTLSFFGKFVKEHLGMSPTVY